MAQLQIACGEFGHLSEGNCLCDSCSEWTETMRTPFHLVTPSRRSGGHKAPPRNFEYFLLCLDVILSVHVQRMCSHVLEIKIQTEQDPNSLPFRGNQVLGRDRHADILFQPSVVSALMVWIHTTSLWCWRSEGNVHMHKKQQQQTAKQTTKYRNLHVGCGVPCWLSGIRVHLPMQETQVWSLVWEDPTCGATKPVHHNCSVCALEPGSCNCWAHGLQLLKPAH